VAQVLSRLLSGLLRVLQKAQTIRFFCSSLKISVTVFPDIGSCSPRCASYLIRLSGEDSTSYASLIKAASRSSPPKSGWALAISLSFGNLSGSLLSEHPAAHGGFDSNFFDCTFLYHVFLNNVYCVRQAMGIIDIHFLATTSPPISETVFKECILCMFLTASIKRNLTRQSGKTLNFYKEKYLIRLF